MRTPRFVLPGFVLLAGACLVGSHSQGEDVEDCIAQAKQTSVACWDRCSSDSCIDRCDVTFNRQKTRCREGINTSKKNYSGTATNGQNGCYYGECPEDLDKRIEESEPIRKRIEEEPTGSEEETQKPPRTKPQPSQRAQFTNICQTPVAWCVMNQTGPVNYPCWCMTPLGMANGLTVPPR